jgi:NitT/TauT family transport system permease protein
MFSKYKLFELRGNLDSRTGFLLQIAGIIIFLIVWWFLSFMTNKVNITQMDDKDFPDNKVAVNDNRYYNNDSLLVADFDQLISKKPEELKVYGLKKITVSNLPSPVEVLKVIPEMFKADNLFSNILQSIKLNVLGYIIAIIFSLIIGFIIGLIPLLRGLFSQLIGSGRFIPLTAVTGIFILWLGIDNEMKVAFLAFGIIVYLIPVVIQRIDEVENVYLHTVFTLGANAWQTFRKVYYPFVMSKLIDDIRVLTAISWTYITIAEMLNKSGGIGQVIWEAKRQSRIDKAFAVLLIIIVIGILQDRLFVLLDRLLFPHKHIQPLKK